MREVGVFLLFYSLLTIFGCMTARDNRRVDALLDEARKKLVPDKRTVVFNVHGSLSGTQLVLRGELDSEYLKQQLFDFIKERENVSIVDSIVVLPKLGRQEKKFGVVNVSVANIRSKPGHAEELVTQAILGTPLKLLKEHGGWYFVQTPDEYLGWTDDVIALFTEEEYDAWSLYPKVMVTTTYGHSFTTAESDGEIVSDIIAGNILKLIEEEGDFFEVEYPRGKHAFIRKEEVEPLDRWLANASDTPEKIITTAKRFMGVPYLWGGTSAKAMDCSGFTKTVFFLNGVLLPRDASQQVRVGEQVSIADSFRHLQMGDLVFFGRKATADRGERVTHVGIYIDNHKFIHEGGDVRINSFNPSDPDYSEHRTATLLHARRIIGVGEERGIRRLTSIPYYRGNEQ
jgi:cell wall-associated NlpC family hydrolase